MFASGFSVVSKNALLCGGSNEISFDGRNGRCLWFSYLCSFIEDSIRHAHYFHVYKFHFSDFSNYVLLLLGFMYCKFNDDNRLILVEIYFNGIEFHQLVSVFISCLCVRVLLPSAILYLRGF